MLFTKKQIAAIVYMGREMVLTDGDVDDKEITILALGVKKWGALDSEIPGIIAEADSISRNEAITTIKSMTSEQKHEVSAYLAEIIKADNYIIASEINKWDEITNLCGLPEMDLEQAHRYWTISLGLSHMY